MPEVNREGNPVAISGILGRRGHRVGEELVYPITVWLLRMAGPERAWFQPFPQLTDHTFGFFMDDGRPVLRDDDSAWVYRIVTGDQRDDIDLTWLSDLVPIASDAEGRLTCLTWNGITWLRKPRTPAGALKPASPRPCPGAELA